MTKGQPKAVGPDAHAARPGPPQPGHGPDVGRKVPDRQIRGRPRVGEQRRVIEQPHRVFAQRKSRVRHRFGDLFIAKDWRKQDPKCEHAQGMGRKGQPEGGFVDAALVAVGRIFQQLAPKQEHGQHDEKHRHNQQWHQVDEVQQLPPCGWLFLDERARMGEIEGFVLDRQPEKHHANPQRRAKEQKPARPTRQPVTGPGGTAGFRSHTDHRGQCDRTENDASDIAAPGTPGKGAQDTAIDQGRQRPKLQRQRQQFHRLTLGRYLACVIRLDKELPGIGKGIGDQRGKHQRHRHQRQHPEPMAIAPVIAAGQGQSAKGADAAAHEIGGQVGRTEPGKVSFEILEPGGPVCPIGGFERIRIGIDKIVRNLIRCRPPCRPCLTFAGAGPPEYPAGHGGIKHRFVLPMSAMRSAGQAKVPFQIIDQRMGNDVAGQMAEMAKRIGPDLLHLDLALAVPGRLVGIVDGFADLDQGGQVKPQRHIHGTGHHRLAVVIRRAFVDGVENPSLTGAEHLGKGGQVRPHRPQDREL